MRRGERRRKWDSGGARRKKRMRSQRCYKRRETLRGEDANEMEGKRKKKGEEGSRRAITVQFVQLTFIMSPSDGVDRAGERLRA